MITKERRYLKSTFEEVSTFSVRDKKELSDEAITQELIDKLLDGLLELKSVIVQKTREVSSITEKMEGLTFLELDEKGLKVANIIISLSRDWAKHLRGVNAKCIELLPKDAVPSELIELLAALDDIEDAAESMESRFFTHAGDPEMQAISSDLNKIFGK
ncbi:MAG: hypothetical protein V4687_00940 [Bacteroidota bacterium]